MKRLYGWAMFLGLALFLAGFFGGVEVGVGVTDPAWAMMLIPGFIGAVVGACGLLEGVGT